MQLQEQRFFQSTLATIMVRMLIADDHPVVRQRLIQLLYEGFPSAVFGEAGDTSLLVTEAMNKEWDIIISDLAMPGGGGLFALEKIKQKKSNPPFLIISTYPAEQYAARAIKAGAVAYLNKDNADAELVVTVKNILQGKTN
jgi:two-component system invasion response regulator UvrY